MSSVRNRLKEQAIQQLLDVGHRNRVIVPVKFGHSSCFTIDISNVSSNKEVFRICIEDISNKKYSSQLMVVSKVEEWQQICNARNLKRPKDFEEIVDQSTMSMQVGGMEVIPLCFK